ncbi:MAG: UDP-N-acetylmuramoyl-tripeptide--D-alanyl-D-alanine ligase, partial [Acidobacteriota bacterium]
MVRRRIDEAARAMGGDVITGDGTAPWTGAALDSRRIRGGELFFALTGETTDGHRFVGDALQRGAAGAVVHRRVEGVPGPGPAGARTRTGAPCLIRVSDTYAGLHALVRTLRRDLPEVLVGITGSVGKTTTKELTYGVLAERFRAARNPGNLNNLFGFPLAFLNIPDDTEVMVAELGMSFPGELGTVSDLARPDGAVLTNVRPAHLENFPDLRAVAEAKAEIFRGLPPGPNAFVVANRDDPEVVRVTERWAGSRGGGRVIWYGLEERS